MTTEVTTAVTAELAAAGYCLRVGRGWHKGDDRSHHDYVQDATVAALQRHSVPATVKAVSDVMSSLPRVATALADDGIPAPTTEELAAEAAWMVDTFWAYGWTRQDSAWVHDQEAASVDAAPEDLRRTAFRAGLFVTTAHGLPQSKAPGMRDVIRALLRRMAREGRIQR
ncbi:hypothetical protein ACFWBR_34900 [Streptomyces sp. NPDC060006]|uniref:hypothetical protein n=1 Tax=unclassified Streptomyces TaxID=2593676 RepID=UPI0036AF431B